MPIISQFYGIVVQMLIKDLPCIKVVYGHYYCIYDLNGNRIEGKLPITQTKLVEAWIILHTIQLNTLSASIKNGNGYFAIEPLK